MEEAEEEVDEEATDVEVRDEECGVGVFLS